MPGGVDFHILDAETAPLLLRSDVFDNAVQPDLLAGFVAREGHALVFATLDDQVVGFASGAELLHPDKLPQFFINEVGVNDPWRRRGIATELVRRLIALARDRGCGDVWLATEDDNEAARATYRKAAAVEMEGVVVYTWQGVEGDPDTTV